MLRAFAIFLLTTFGAAAFSPDLRTIDPRGGKRGTEVKVTLRGDRLFEPQEILFYKKGISVKSLTKGKDQKRVDATFVIAPDAELGEYAMRLRCKGGITYIRTFWVGQFETVKEKRSKDNKRDLNNDFEKPQQIDLNVTVQGVADHEDADYYRVAAKQGQRLSVEVEGVRLGRVMFDPYVAILDSKRFELATSDDSALLKQDCATSIIVPADGDYTILVRESSYEGTKSCQYRMHVGTFPRPIAVYPPAAKPGEEVEFTFIGDSDGEIKQRINIGNETFAAYAKSGALTAPSGNTIHVSPLNYLNETEPNEGRKTANPQESPPAAPTAFHGIIGKKGDKDWFRFTAKKGKKLRINVISRELRSPLDSFIILRKAKDGKEIKKNDDRVEGAPDSRIDFDVPEDGEYLLNIRDQLHRGGPEFTYRIEITERPTSLSFTLPSQDRNDRQKEKMILVPRGNRIAIAPNITRTNTRSDLKFLAPKLPAGVSAKAHLVAKSINSFPILFEAKPDAPLTGGLFPMLLEDPKSKLRGPFTEAIPQITINNQGDYQINRSETASIAVIEEAPFHIELFAPPVPLVRNGTMNLKITAKRVKDFKKPIKINLPWKPPGVGAPNEIEIPEGKTEAYLTINAKGDAPLKEWQLLVTAFSDTDRGRVRVASKFVKVQVAEPFLNATLAMAATNPGKNTGIIAKIEHLQPFSGEAKIILHALPHGVKSKEQKLNSKTSELTFPLEVAADARKGKHKNLFCQVIITKDGHPIPHNVAHGGVLRIDPPPPAPKKKKTAPIAAKSPEKKAEKKPLSRLEQLRESKP